MAEAKESKKGIMEADSTVPAGVQSITESLPAASPASKDVGPSAPDKESEAPPLHTARPDVPIAQVLAAGAGEHTPPDPKVFDSEGRPKEIDAG
jgi:hypothetical protein